jgi:hypothetical protein
LRLLLVWKYCLCVFVAVLKDSCNHTKPPATMQAET